MLSTEFVMEAELVLATSVIIAEIDKVSMRQDWQLMDLVAAVENNGLSI